MSERMLEGREAPLDISDVDVLLSLSHIIGRYPVSLTRVHVKRKNLLARDINARNNEQEVFTLASQIPTNICDMWQIYMWRMN